MSRELNQYILKEYTRLHSVMEQREFMEKVTMSVQELSAQMGISLPKAYELVKTPGFPTIRVGTRILIPVEAYREWLLRNAANDQ